MEPTIKFLQPNRNAVKPWQVWHENGIKDYAINSNSDKLLHEFYCEVWGIVAIAVSWIDSLDGEAHKLSKKQYPIMVKVWHHCFAH